ncbi:MAG: MBL fold metallo-hydrolase [Polyangiaceae bacterium]|jgi:L-ascorbate metabolism protein UlaG (beta-lactamase superfamily)
MRRLLFTVAFLSLGVLSGCSGFLFSSPRPVPNRITQPLRADARLAVLWVGHATVLVQMDDKLILTDPLLGNTVGQLTRRLQEPGIDPANLPPLDAVVVSHMHFDHLSLGSLDTIEPKVRRLFVPQGGLVYVPNYAFDARELPTWQSFEDGGLRITAVPVKHVGFRYGVDAAWMKTSFTGYVFEYHGLTVYFSGDTAYDQEHFRETAARFPSIDLALIAIAPIHPRSFMEATHVDPAQAVQAFLDLGARTMVPIHYGTLVNGFDAPGEARATLVEVMKKRGLGEDRVKILPIGGQAVIVGRAGSVHQLHDHS